MPLADRSQTIRDGYLPVPGGQVWFQIVGHGAAAPLLVLHGGPGVPHDYLEPVGRLGLERPVVFYDQLGCGRSDRPDDPQFWQVEHFMRELAIMREQLGLERVHLLGHSWGSMLAIDYALSRPDGLLSLTLVSPPLCMPRWHADIAALRQALPAEVRETLERHEAAGTTDSPGYEAATLVFYQRHLCRLDPWPEPVIRSFAGVGRALNLAMWGISGCYVTGSLRTYDRGDCLGEIAVPTLFACGRFDEATPETTAWYQSLVPGAELAIFEQSSHMPQIEEPDHFLAVVGAFLRRVEAKEGVAAIVP